jgi:hypothetical protein
MSSKNIEDSFNRAQDALVLQNSDLSLQSISDMVDSQSIDISPKYQRRERWDIKKESDLIESFLLNIPVPPVYLAEDEYGTYSVIDGKQRVTAINKFLQGKFKLTELEKFIELEGKYFNDLPTSLKNALKIRPYLRVVTLLRQSDPDLKHEVFLRLNKAGVALNSQEIRNVAFRGAFNDLLFELSEQKYFKEQLRSQKGTKIYSEMLDVQYVLRFFTVQDCWEHFPGNMDVAMDRFMLKNYKSAKKDIAVQKKSFLDALSFCEHIWETDGFLKPGGSKRIIQGFYDIQMVCSSLLTATQRANAFNKKSKVKKALIDLLNKDQTFSESITQFTSNPTNLKYRIETFTEILKSI